MPLSHFRNPQHIYVSFGVTASWLSSGTVPDQNDQEQNEPELRSRLQANPYRRRTRKKVDEKEPEALLKLFRGCVATKYGGPNGVRTVLPT